MKKKPAIIAMEKYIRIYEEIKKQERDSQLDDPDSIGTGVDERLFEALYAACEEFHDSVTPSDYEELLKQVALHRDNTCELILENIALKAEVKRLGGDPEFIGNIIAKGHS